MVPLNLNNFPINVWISENCKDKPETFMTIMAHELSHVLLHSLRHKEMDNEIYTDITAILLGFSVVIKKRKKSN
jgi:Zn-dependent peptidase ImmA (M78 family)